MLAHQTDGAAVQLPPNFGGHPSTLARQQFNWLVRAEFAMWFYRTTAKVARQNPGFSEKPGFYGFLKVENL